MPKRFLVNSSPHYRAEWTTRTVMGDVIIALLPAVAAATVFFGLRALVMTVVSVAGCIASETLYNAIAKKNNTISDLSCVVTGMLIAFCVPVAAPYWLVVIGDVFAIVVVKMLFGGLGKNFLNPALAGRAFLFSWPSLMTTFTAPMLNTALPVFSDPVFSVSDVSEYIDSISSATPLESLKSGVMPSGGLWSLFVGNHAGSIGETCSLVLILGGVFLLFRRVISWHIPVSYLGTVALLTFVFPRNGKPFDVNFMLAELFSGGLMLAAFFMATDHSTSPMTGKGRLIYGCGCGLLTVLLRYYGGYPEGVGYAILLMNIFALSLDKITAPKRYGIGGGYHVGK